MAAPAVPTFRARLLDGLAASIAERGYRATTVADIVRHARTSKRTFYGEFTDKEECFVELLRANNDELIAGIRAAVDEQAPWRDQIARPPTPTSTTSRRGRRSPSAGSASCRRSAPRCAPFSARR